MTLTVSYMGTKRTLAPLVVDLVRADLSGQFLDLFAGTCAVSSAIAPYSNVWCNDSLSFSSLLARQHFTSRHAPPGALIIAKILSSYFQLNHQRLTERFNDLVNLEDRAVAGEKMRPVAQSDELARELTSTAHAKRMVAVRRGKAKATPFALFTATYAGTYLGLRQCIHVDSIRYALDAAVHDKRLSEETRRWLLLALCKAVSQASTSTGHFAQYLVCKKSNWKRHTRQRRMSIWDLFLASIDTLCPTGSKNWRARNKVTRSDANNLLRRLERSRGTKVPRVVYADPPYTDDQYSRYYHLYETLITYDYPKIGGKARYPLIRFRSSFSVKTEVEGAFEQLIGACRQLEAKLLISYPTNGLLDDSQRKITALIKKHYGRVAEVVKIAHHHSAMGASKGVEKTAVTEMLYYATCR